MKIDICRQLRLDPYIVMFLLLDTHIMNVALFHCPECLPKSLSMNHHAGGY